MPIRPTSRLVALSAVFALSLSVPGIAAASDAPIAVQERPLVLPKLPEGTDMPVNLPGDGAVKMPFVTGGAPGVAARINAAVWREMLDGAVAPTTPGKTFTPPRDHLPQGTSSLGYTATLIPASGPRLLVLAFSGEGCGAYCEEFTSTRLFDLRDGREITPGDLLTVEGFSSIGSRVDAERRRAYEAQVRTLRADLKAASKEKGAHKPAADADDDTADRLALNEDCLKNVRAQAMTPQWLVDEDFAPDGKGGLVITIGRCSNHAMRALDDVDEIKVAVPAADLRPALTPYGLAVLRREGEAPGPAAGFTGRELRGRLAGLAITMRLEPMRKDAETRGTYQYDKFHTPIPLSVHWDGESLGAVEQADSQGEFELRPNGGSLVGTWRDKAHRRELPVILQ